MAQNFLSCDREQAMLLPANLADWLPAGHLARFVIDVVERLDLGGIYGYYRADGHGRPAHDPAMMTALLLYNYAVGVRSSRAIERRCVEDVACRVIAANRAPDHTTIARFRALHQDALSGLFFDLLGLCRDAGMVSVGTVAVDSTKLAANASVDANRTYEGLRAEAKRILEEAGEVDAAEDRLYGERRGDELPAELADPGSRAGRIQELLERAKARREQEQAERERLFAKRAEHQARTGKQPSGHPPVKELGGRARRRLEQAKYNVTDPDSGIVRHRGMLMQGYNVQTAVGEGQVILAASALSVSTDHGQLAAIVEEARANLDRVGVSDRIEEILADSGYWHQKQINCLQEQGIRVLIPPPNKNAKSPDHVQSTAREMKAELQTDEGRQAYGRRQQIVEPVYARTKYHRGITRLMRRGKQAVQAEINLIAATHNLLKLHTALQTA